MLHCKTVLLITNDVDEGILLADRIIPLNPGPKASLGPVFEVMLYRPREKISLNHNPEYKRLRNEITKYLIEAGMSRNTGVQRDDFVLPDLVPLDLHEADNFMV